MRVIIFSLIVLILCACGNLEADGYSDGKEVVPHTASEAQPSAQDTQPSDNAPLEGGAIWLPDNEKSTLTFTATQQGEQFEGKFNTFDMSIRLNPENTDGAQIKATIDMSSVDAGSKDRNGALPTGDWFKIKSFPTAIFTSDNIIKTGDGTYEAVGTLTIKGITQPLRLPFALSIDGDTARATGTVGLNRTDFKVGEGAYATDQWVGYGVEVSVDIYATRG